MIERRIVRRFAVDWQVRVECDGDSGERLIETGRLHNISSNGALFAMTRPLAAGTQLDVYIKLPLQGKKWMKYPARVVRIERGVAVTAAVRFDSARPDFGVEFITVSP